MGLTEQRAMPNGDTTAMASSLLLPIVLALVVAGHTFALLARA